MTDLCLDDNKRAPIPARARAKKVAFVQTQAENAGAQEIARQLARGAERNGWETRQIFFFRRTESFDGEDNVFFCARQRPSTPFGVLKLLYQLYKEIRREAPDTVVTLQHYGNLLAAPIARLAGVRLVVANQLSHAETIPGPVRAADRLLGRLGFYDHIVVNSAHTEAAYNNYPPAYSRRITRIDHGFFDKSAALDKQEARRALRLPETAELLGCATRLHPLKQVDLAIRLLSLNKEQHLALAGQGPERERLEELARALGVRERVHFLGELDTARMGAFLAALDCFVFPSAAESFGLAPVEAAQAGIPVVATDIEVLREVLSVAGEPCALFVDVRDTAAFASAARRALDDGKLRLSLVSSGRRLAQRYPLDAMIGEYLKLMNGPPHDSFDN
jgi:glycosyltransferase involved in cell wall biosynthesis